MKVCWQQNTTLLPTNDRFVANKRSICWQQTGIKTPFQFTQTPFYGNEMAGGFSISLF
jgi:hypothetical protein